MITGYDGFLVVRLKKVLRGSLVVKRAHILVWLE